VYAHELSTTLGVVFSGLRDSEVNGGGWRVARSGSGSEVRKENGGREGERTLSRGWELLAWVNRVK